jgi:hypothetical protein
MGEGKRMEKTNDTPVMVPYVVYRDAVADNRWIIRKLIIALIISVLLLFASNGMWLYVWNQYDYMTEETLTTVDSEGAGIANFTGGNGGVIVAEGDSTTKDDDT